jgi:hypothetical protein
MPASRPALPRFIGFFFRGADFPPDARFLRGGDLEGEGLWRDVSAVEKHQFLPKYGEETRKITVDKTYCVRPEGMIPYLL